jgi:hypothetical protein
MIKSIMDGELLSKNIQIYYLTKTALKLANISKISVVSSDSLKNDSDSIIPSNINIMGKAP